MQQIADHFEAGFHISYDELDNMVYDEALYENGKLGEVFFRRL